MSKPSCGQHIPADDPEEFLAQRLSGFLRNPLVTGFFSPPLRYFPWGFIAHRGRHSHGSSADCPLVLYTHALALSATENRKDRSGMNETVFCFTFEKSTESRQQSIKASTHQFGCRSRPSKPSQSNWTIRPR